MVLETRNVVDIVLNFVFFACAHQTFSCHHVQ